jgi:hypothetical protein
MISHVKRVLFEYHTFLVKMALDARTITFIIFNFFLLIN